jgi:hypothetical protein
MSLIILCLLVVGVSLPQKAWASENLVQDPGFEKGGDEWDDWGSTEIVKSTDSSGKFALRCGPGAGGRAQDVADVAPGKHYLFSFSAKMSEAETHASIGLTFKDASGNTIPGYSWQTEITSTNYQTYSFTVSSPSEFDRATIYLWKDTGLFYLHADDFKLEEK